MERSDYEQAIAQLTGAAELVASGVTQEQRAQAFEMLAFFRLLRGRIGESGVPVISNDELFEDTAIAALTMAGRKEFLAAAALLEQARGLVHDEASP
ncbi:hypothetical protein [Caballeronia ptereochthonis]|uniref:Uncharacterized protein n=1 Tax=Caballeronia ptereochthonis TaxID=1777144 RepID=A0A157ZD52_9BURK|nr:hypothetical protein [Caballeronia ptereochthonis]SAK43418.1 hypothetical protein AWB83_00450 [Caballeronia ptereochthonis]